MFPNTRRQAPPIRRSLIHHHKRYKSDLTARDSGNQKTTNVVDDALMSGALPSNRNNDEKVSRTPLALAQKGAEQAEIITERDLGSPRSSTPNFSRRELGHRKSSSLPPTPPIHSRPQALNSQPTIKQEDSPPHTAPAASETTTHVTIESPTSRDSFLSVSKSPPSYKLVLLGGGAVGKSPLVLQVGYVNRKSNIQLIPFKTVSVRRPPSITNRG